MAQYVDVYIYSTLQKWFQKYDISTLRIHRGGGVPPLDYEWPRYMGHVGRRQFDWGLEICIVFPFLGGGSLLIVVINREGTELSKNISIQQVPCAKVIALMLSGP